MKKILLATACFALMLSSCVKNFESESVTAMRDAQTALLLSQAKVNEAEAAAVALLAEADAAIKKAEAEALAVETAIREVEKQLKEVELESAKADLELKLAELEAKKAELAAQMEAAAVLAEQALVDAKNALELSKQAYLDTLDNVEAAKAARLATLFYTYTQAVEDLINAKSNVITATSTLVAAEKGLVSAEEYRDKVLAEEDENIAEANRQIALYEQRIAYVEAYKDADAKELQAAIDELDVKGLDLYKAADFANDDYNKAAEELDIENDPYDHPYYAFLSENPLGLYEVKVIDGVAWYGFNVVENDDPLTATVEKEFYPVYVCYDYMDYNEDYEYVQFGYNLFAEEEVEVKATYPEDENYEVVTYYYELVGLGEYNAENVAKLAAYNKEQQEGLLEAIEQVKAQLAEAEANVPLFKGATEKAQAWAEAQAVYDALVLDTTEEQYMDETMYMPVKTTYGKYVEADMAYNGGVTYHPMTGMEMVIEGTNTKYDTAMDNTEAMEGALETAEKAREEAEKALEEAEKALENAPADATPEQKGELAGAVETAKAKLEEAKAAEAEALRALNFAKEAEEVAKRLNEAAKAELDAAKKALDAEKEKVEPARLAAEKAKHDYDLYYDEHASNLGADKYAGEWVENYETGEWELVVTAADTFSYWTNQYESSMEQVAYLESYIERSEAQYEAAVAFADEDAEKFLATAEELAAGVEDYVAEYNAAQKALTDLEVAKYFAWYAYDLNYEAKLALTEHLAGIKTLDDEIAGYEETIEGFKADIKASEENKETVSNLATQEQAIENAKTRLELAQATVEFLQARADAAKAAWEAAEQE